MPGPPPLVTVLIWFLSIIFMLGLGAIVLKVFRAYEGRASRSLMYHYQGIEPHSAMQPGDVILVYHTYHGVLAWHTETTHRVILPPDEARRLLGRLFRHNLKWGWLVHGGFFAIPLAIINYMAQRRSIARQEAAHAAPQFWAHAVPVEKLSDEGYGSALQTAACVAEPRSVVRRALGWFTAASAVLLVVAAVSALISAEIEGAIGAIVLALVFAAIARNWIRGKPIE